MGCISNPITDNQISDMLDGSRDPDVIEHLKQCADCSMRLDVARQIETMFLQKLFRYDCPASMELGDYRFDFLNQDRKVQIKAHLEICSRCSTEYHQFIAVQSDDPVPEMSDIERLLDNIVYPPERYFIANVQRIRLKRARGEKEQFRVHTDDLQILLDIQLSDTGYTIEGLLIPTASDDTQWQGGYIEVRMDDRLEAVAFVDEMGTFDCEVRQAGTVVLVLVAANGNVIAIPDVPIIP